MAFEVPVDDVNTDAIGGFDRVMEGCGHFEITSIDEDGGKKGEMIVGLECLRHNCDNQEGKELRLYFAKEMSEQARRKVHAFAIATGLITKEAIEKHKANRTSPSYDFTTTVGKQVCCNLERNEWEGRVSTRLVWDQVFHPTDKRASHIPLHVGKLQAAGIKLPAGRNPDGAVKSANGSANGDKKSTVTKDRPEPAKQAASVDELLN